MTTEEGGGKRRRDCGAEPVKTSTFAVFKLIESVYFYTQPAPTKKNNSNKNETVPKVFKRIITINTALQRTGPSKTVGNTHAETKRKEEKKS